MALKINSKTKVHPDYDFEKAIENLERVFLSGMVNVFRDEAWPEGVDIGCRSINMDSMMLFDFNFNNERIELDDELFLKGFGFDYSNQSRTYRKIYVIPKGKDIGDGTFSGLIPKMQKFFIDFICRNDIEPVVKNIIERL